LLNDVIYILGVRVPDIGRMMGQLWRLLPDDEKEVVFIVAYINTLVTCFSVICLSLTTTKTTVHRLIVWLLLHGKRVPMPHSLMSCLALTPHLPCIWPAFRFNLLTTMYADIALSAVGHRGICCLE